MRVITIGYNSMVDFERIDISISLPILSSFFAIIDECDLQSSQFSSRSTHHQPAAEVVPPHSLSLR